MPSVHVHAIEAVTVSRLRSVNTFSVGVFEEKLRGIINDPEQAPGAFCDLFLGQHLFFSRTFIVSTNVFNTFLSEVIVDACNFARRDSEAWEVKWWGSFGRCAQQREA